MTVKRESIQYFKYEIQLGHKELIETSILSPPRMIHYKL